jgi:hypothetical protein
LPDGELASDGRLLGLGLKRLMISDPAAPATAPPAAPPAAPITPPITAPATGAGSGG